MLIFFQTPGARHSEMVFSAQQNGLQRGEGLLCRGPKEMKPHIKLHLFFATKPGSCMAKLNKAAMLN